MRGASRASYAELRERLSAEARGVVTAQRVGDELFAVVRLLDDEHGLRRALADPTKPADEKRAVAARLLHGKISAPTERLVTDAVAASWATPGELSDAIEQLAIEALTIVAQNETRSMTWRTTCSGSAAWSPRSRACGPP